MGDTKILFLVFDNSSPLISIVTALVFYPALQTVAKCYSFRKNSAAFLSLMTAVLNGIRWNLKFLVFLWLLETGLWKILLATCISFPLKWSYFMLYVYGCLTCLYITCHRRTLDLLELEFQMIMSFHWTKVFGRSSVLILWTISPVHLYFFENHLFRSFIYSLVGRFCFLLWFSFCCLYILENDLLSDIITKGFLVHKILLTHASWGIHSQLCTFTNPEFCI